MIPFMRPTLAALVLVSAARLVAATGDVPLAPVRQAPLPGAAHPAIATSGLEYLIAYSRGDEAYWQRIGAEGTPIDQIARRLDDAELHGGPSELIQIVWTGQTYLVFWNEENARVVAQSIDRDGKEGAEFTVVTGMTLRDVARAGNEVAVLTSAGSTWRLTLLNALGTPLGGYTVSSTASVLQIVRVDGTWALARPAATGVALVVPATGSSRVVAPGRAYERVVASPGGGALLIGTDASLAILTPAGAVVPVALQHPIERLALSRAAIVSPFASGWTVFYRSGGAARTMRLTSAGSIESDALLGGAFPSPAGGYAMIAAGSADADRHLLLQPAVIGTAVGLESIAVSKNHAYVTSPYAVTDAIQQWARTAHGVGIDLVAWLEASENGWEVRASRVQNGSPLDGSGILLASGFPSSLAAAFDGRDFAVAWSDTGGIFVRRIDMQGAFVDRDTIQVSTIPIQQVVLAGSGDGGLLAGWPGSEPTVAYLRGGRIRATVPVGSPQTGPQIEVGGSRDSYLVGLADPEPECHFDPCVGAPPAVRVVTPTGAAAGPAVPIAESPFGRVGKPVFHGGEWFVPLVFFHGPEIVRLSASGTAVIDRVPALEGTLRGTADAVAILADAFRGMLTVGPANDWYEPLPLAEGEAAEGAMAASDTLLVNSDGRYVLRPLSAAAAVADIVLVLTGRVGSGTHAYDSVRIEHRGGDPVPALHVRLWPDLHVTSSRPIVDGRIEGPFAQGETIDLVVRGVVSSPSLLAVLPEARESVAEDNFLALETTDEPPPPAKRRRLVGR